jgi:alpha-1,2-mannosyltransferase
VTIPDYAAATAWLRRWGFACGLAVVFALAVGVRLNLTLRTAGGLLGLGNYDDGVHFAAAMGLINGVLPYRDFLLLHPPGVVLCLAPFAAFSWLIGEPGAVVVARVSWMILGGLNAVLCGLVLRPIGRVPGLVAALFYALFLGAVYVEYTALLEAPATTVMLAALVLTRLLGSGAGIGRTHYLLAGALLGLSPVLKIWGVVTVLVIVVGILARRGRRPGLLTLGAAVAATAVLCLPFFLAAPGQMWRMVVVAQLGRRRGEWAPAERLNDILGIRFWVGSQPTLQVLTVVMIVVILAAVGACLTRADLRIVAALLLTHGALVLAAPMWFLHYAGLTAAPIALVLGGSVGAIMGWSGRVQRVPWIGWTVGSVAVLGTVVLALSLPRWGFGSALFPGKTLASGVEDQSGCLATDWPMSLLQMDLLQRNLDRGCRLVVDIGGYSYYLVDSEFSDVSRRRNDDFQTVILTYYRSADAVVPVRFSTRSGYSNATAKEIASWPVVAKAGRFVVREPLPEAR